MQDTKIYARKKDDPEYYNKYYNANKDKYQEEIRCICGMCVKKYCLSKHKKTRIHNALMKNKLIYY